MIRQSENMKLRMVVTYLILAFLNMQVFGNWVGNNSFLFADNPSCVKKLDLAEENYYDDNFEDAIDLVNQCLQEPSLTESIRLRAYKILARTYLAMDNIQLAKENILKILVLESSYQPTIEQETPGYVNLVTEIRKERAQLAASAVETGISTWLLIGAGSVAAVAIIALVATGGDDNGNNTSGQPRPLSEPPPFPN
jgi:hypothetical protein